MRRQTLNASLGRKDPIVEGQAMTFAWRILDYLTPEYAMQKSLLVPSHLNRLLQATRAQQYPQPRQGYILADRAVKIRYITQIAAIEVGKVLLSA
jgi:hypothetical protein